MVWSLMSASWISRNLMDVFYKLCLLTEILSVRDLWQIAFYWTLWDQVLCTIKKKPDLQSDRLRGVAVNRNNKIYTHRPGNEPFNCVSHPSFSQPTSYQLILHSVCRWVALQILFVVKCTQSHKNRLRTCEKKRLVLFLHYSFWFNPLCVFSFYLIVDLGHVPNYFIILLLYLLSISFFTSLKNTNNY